jgi:hypothetical protein
VIMRGKVRVCVAALVMAGVSPQFLQAQEPYAHATVDSTHHLVGDAIPVHVQISHDAGAAVRPLFADTLGGFTILGSSPFHNEGEKVSAGDVVVAKYDSGDAVLPPLQFLLTAPGDTAGKRVATNELRLTIQTVAVDTSQDIKDLKAPLGIPLTWQEILLACALVLAVAAAVYAFYRWWKRRQMRLAPAYTAPAKPAHVVAFEELGALKQKRLWQQGLVKQYYTEVTDILRRYFENRYRLMALERTTDEILDDLNRIRMTGDLVGKADRLLRRADLVKFAKHQPATPEHDESMQIVFDVVERTRIHETAASPGTGEKADVGA